MSEIEGLELIARAMKETSQTVARQAGELQAMFIVLHGMLAFDGLPSATKEMLNLALERCAASNLHAPVNDEFLKGFLGRVELLKSSLLRRGDARGSSPSPAE